MISEKIVNVGLKKLTEGIIKKSKYDRIIIFKNEPDIDWHGEYSFITKPWKTVLGKTELVFGSHYKANPHRIFCFNLRRPEKRYDHYSENTPYLKIFLGFSDSWFTPSIVVKINNEVKFTPEMQNFKLFGRKGSYFVHEIKVDMTKQNKKLEFTCTRLLGELIERMDLDDKVPKDCKKIWYERRDGLMDLYINYINPYICYSKIIK